jgi:hypothetical protein
MRERPQSAPLRVAQGGDQGPLQGLRTPRGRPRFIGYLRSGTPAFHSSGARNIIG